MNDNQFKSYMEAQQKREEAQQKRDEAQQAHNEEQQRIIKELMEKLTIQGIGATKSTTTLPNVRSLEVDKDDINENWQIFRENFESYMVIANLPKNEEDGQRQQYNMLMLTIGDAAKKKFKDFGITEADKAKPLTEILDIIQEKVREKIPVLLERFKFYAVCQEEDETFEDFTKRIEKAAELCKFDTLSKAIMIRDRAILGTKDRTMLKRMFEKEETTLTLEQVKLAGKASESTSKFLSEVESSGSSTVKKIQAPEKYRQSEAKAKLCNYCGDKHERGKCPAYGKMCSNCKRKNHFAKVCGQKQAGKSKKVKSVGQDDDSDDDSMKSVEQIIDNSGKGGGVQAELSMQFDENWTKVNCDIDTGAEVCIIGHDFLCNMMKNKAPKLIKTIYKLKSVTGETIKVLGRITIPVRRRKTTFRVRFQVIEPHHGPLLSANASQKLGLVKFCNSVTKKVADEAKKIPQNLLKQAEEIIKKHAKVFEGYGRLPGKAKIEVDPAVTPSHQRPRRFPTAKRKALKESLEVMERDEIIVRQDEPTDWSSNILMVSRGGKFRPCLDPIILNKAVKRPDRQFTTIDEILPELTKAKVFSTVDASKGFWQVELDDESSKLTTFSTPFGNYRWLRLPFGISSAPEIFQIKLSEVLNGLEGTEALADDILIFGCGETMEEAMKDHNIKLEALMQRMEKNNCKLNKEKLKLCQTKVKFFGHYLTTDGLEADESKIKAIRDFPVPKDKKGLQRFLGMITYLGRYVDNLSQESAALRKIAVPRSEWKWSIEEQREFEKLKAIIIKVNPLKYFDMSKRIVLECDASSEGIGAVLKQDEKPLAFASRKLSNAERNGYAMIEKEMAAIVFGCTRFHQMLIGNQTVVRTDHKPLINIYGKPLIDAPKRLQMMMMVLHKYNLTFEFIKGSKNIVADALSRAPIEEPEREAKSEEKTAMVYEIQEEKTIQDWCKSVKLIKYLSISDEIVEKVKEATKRDQSMQQLKSHIVNGWPETAKELSEDIRAYHKHKEELAWQDDLVFRGRRIVIPFEMRKQIVEKVHTAHNGIEASQKLAQENVYWPGMLQQIEDKVKMCQTCAKFSASQRKQPMMSHEIPKYPFQYVSMDCFETTLKGRKKNFLITVDHYSDYFELDILADMTPSSVIKASKTNFSRFGVPQRVCTDGGTNFDNKAMKAFAKEWSFEHVKSAPNHQQANGKAEAAVKIAKNLIKKSEEEGKDFEFAILHWRNTPNKVNSSPNQRLMSRSTRTSIPTSIDNLKPRIIAKVPETIEKKREKAKEIYDESTQQRRELKVGENVMVQLRHGQDKTWSTGKVVEQHSERAYDVKVKDTVYRRDEVHVKPSAPGAYKAAIPVEQQQSAATPVEQQQSTATPVERQQHATTPVVQQQPATTPVVKKQPATTPVVEETPRRQLRNRATLKTPSWQNNYQM